MSPKKTVEAFVREHCQSFLMRPGASVTDSRSEARGAMAVITAPPVKILVLKEAEMPFDIGVSSVHEPRCLWYWVPVLAEYLTGEPMSDETPAEKQVRFLITHLDRLGAMCSKSGWSESIIGLDRVVATIGDRRYGPLPDHD